MRACALVEVLALDGSRNAVLLLPRYVSLGASGMGVSSGAVSRVGSKGERRESCHSLHCESGNNAYPQAGQPFQSDWVGSTRNALGRCDALVSELASLLSESL